MKKSEYHESVMVREVIENLHIKKACKYIDATLGTGGHAEEIIKAGGEVLGIETDPAMLAVARKRLGTKAKLVQGNFVDIDPIAKEFGFEKVDGILFDLGVSNIHLTDEARGFSFGNPDAPLDMRLNTEVQGVKASDLLNVLREDQLRELFEATLDPGAAKWVAARVVKARPLTNVGDFLSVLRGLRSKPGLSPATLPFLALRIAVNSELDNLKEALPKALDLLVKGGRLVVISFHSGEDRIVKEFGGSDLILPTGKEVETNPRSRSAKMRVITKK